MRHHLLGAMQREGTPTRAHVLQRLPMRIIAMREERRPLYGDMAACAALLGINRHLLDIPCHRSNVRGQLPHPWSSSAVTASSIAKTVILTSCAPLPQMNLQPGRPQAPLTLYSIELLPGNAV